MLNPALAPRRPWYKEPWPWILFGLPGVAVIGSMISLYCALQTDDSVVADDYYKQGLAINQSLERDAMANKLGIHAFVALQGRKVLINLRFEKAGQAPDTIRMHWIHPTRAGADQIVLLKHEQDGYSGDLADMPAGRWNVSVEDTAGKWRVVGSVNMPFSGQKEIRHLEAVDE